MILAARARGLEAISQVRFQRFNPSQGARSLQQLTTLHQEARHQLILRKQLSIPDNEIVMLGMSRVWDAETMDGVRRP
jgi:hypothetical protein